MEIKKNLGRIASGSLLGLALLVSGCGSDQNVEVKNLTYRGYHVNKADGEYSLVFEKARDGKVFASGNPKDFVEKKCYNLVLDDSGFFPGLPEIKSYKSCN